MDVTVTHPLQDATRARAATTPGHAMTVAYENKCRIAEELCREQEIAFIPVVAESLGGWHQVALDQFRKLGSALARHTGQDEGGKVDATTGARPRQVVHQEVEERHHTGSVCLTKPPNF